MALWLRTLAPIPDDLSLVLCTNMEAHKHYNSGSRGPDTFFWPSWAPGQVFSFFHYETRFLCVAPPGYLEIPL